MYQMYACDEAERAFRHMASGQHTGKVLVCVREEERDVRALPTPVSVRAVCRALPNPLHTYVITGGLGGFGIELAQWLINRGATR